MCIHVYICIIYVHKGGLILGIATVDVNSVHKYPNIDKLYVKELRRKETLWRYELITLQELSLSLGRV